MCPYESLKCQDIMHIQTSFREVRKRNKTDLRKYVDVERESTIIREYGDVTLCAKLDLLLLKEKPSNHNHGV